MATAPSSPRIQTQPESYYQLMLSLQPERRSILIKSSPEPSNESTSKTEVPILSRPLPAITIHRTPSSKSRAARRKSVADTVSLYSAASAPLEDHIKLFQPMSPADGPSSAPPWITSMPQPSAPDANSGGVVPGSKPTQVKWRPMPEIRWKTFGELSQISSVPIQSPPPVARHKASMSSSSQSTAALSSSAGISDVETSSTAGRIMAASPGADLSTIYQREASHLSMVRPLVIKVKERNASIGAVPASPPILPRKSSMRTGKTASFS
jgi:hypothetical protein